MNTTDASVLNVFIVESRFQALVALLIARSQPDATHLVFYQNEDMGSFISRFEFIQAIYLGPDITTGPWKRPRKLRRMVQHIANTVDSYRHRTTRVNVFIANLKTHLLNYSVNRLRHTVNWAPISFQIITDGTFNFRRYDMTEKHRREQRNVAGKWRYRWLGLALYVYDCDLHGIEDPLIDKIWLLPHSPHQYDPARVTAVPVVDLGLRHPDAPQQETRALVIGERLCAKGYLDDTEERQVNQQIADVLQAKGITHVDFVKHPNAPRDDTAQPWYTPIITQDPVELRLMSHDYRVVIASVSTALITARMLCPPSCEVISVALERCAGRKQTVREVEQAFRGLGVVLIP